MLDPVVVVRWTVTRTPWQSIEAWQSKPGLAGLDVPPNVQRAILEELRSWAQAVFGDLHREVSCEEAYVLQGVGLGDHGARDGEITAIGPSRMRLLTLPSALTLQIKRTL